MSAKSTKDQVLDQVAHAGIPLMITWAVYNYPFLVVLPAFFILFLREYYQSNLYPGTLWQKLRNINYLKIDMISIYIGTVLSIVYVLWRMA